MDICPGASISQNQKEWSCPELNILGEEVFVVSLYPVVLLLVIYLHIVSWLLLNAVLETLVID